MADPPAFRHDPRKAVLVLKDGGNAPVLWHAEPAVCGYRRLTQQSKGSDQSIAVPICSTPAVVTGVGVVIASYDGRIRLFDRCLDKVYWERRLDSPLYASLVVDPRRRTVVVAATSGLVECLDLRGNVLWSARTQFPVYATPTVLPDGGVLVFAAFRSRCIGLNLETGAEVFSLALPKPWYAAYGGSAAHRDPYASPATTETGDAVVCCAEHVLCLAPDGTELWRQEVGASVRSSPAAIHAAGQVAISTVDGRCVFLDSQTGHERGSVSLGAKITASPAVSGDVLAVGTQDESAFGLDVRQHQVRWRTAHGAPRDHTSFSVLPDGNFVATTSRGNVVGMDRSDGRFLWETNQLLGLANHDPSLDITPVVGPDGSMYCGSYSGFAYHFRFRPGDGRPR